MVTKRKTKRFYVEGSFGQIHCRGVFPEHASKSPVICCHMSPKSSRSFEQILPYLAQNRFAVAPDYPGYGESDPPPEEPPVSVMDYANAIWEVVDSLTAEPVHIMGYHTGSMVAVEAAYQRPKQVLSLINISAPVFTEEEQARLHKEFAPIPLDEAGTRFKIMWERVLFHRGPGMTLEMAAESYAENFRGGENYEHGHRAAFNYADTYITRLKQLEHRILIMNPKDDCYEQSKRSDSLVQRGERKDYLNWGHGFMNAYPAAAAKEMLDFFDDTDT